MKKPVQLFLKGVAAFLLAMFLVIPLFSQIVKEGTLPGIKYNIPDSKEVFTVPVDVDWEQIYKEDEFDKEYGLPMRAGIVLPFGKSINEFGEWIALPDGRMLWRATFFVEGASDLSVVLTEFELEDGSEIYLFNEGKKMIYGALGSHNNNEERSLSTHKLPGEYITIEYLEKSKNTSRIIRNEYDNDLVLQEEIDPSTYKSRNPFVISEIWYIYRNPVSSDNSKPNTDGSAACHVDINCEVGLAWQNKKRGILHMQWTDGTWLYWCSASLINNTAEDMTPYVLTAWHCIDGMTEPQLANLQQFYFNYEKPNCGSGTPPTNQMMQGAMLRAEHPIAGGSDFALLELNQTIPNEYNPFFNGWNRTNTEATSGAGIHHPAGDVKKISTFNDNLSSATPNIGGSLMASNAAWEVVWSQNVSGWGVTAGGSSGSPIFDQDGLIVGQLSGGSSECHNQTAPDFYGKMWYNWDLNGPNANQRLKPWLDPLDNNPETLEGCHWEDCGSGIGNPLTFSALTASSTQINLNWTKNADNDDVILAFSLDNTFGTPVDGTSYSAGQTLPGGGEIIYAGANESHIHSGLSSSTNYYYKIFSVNNDTEYSTGRNANATTEMGNATFLVESFEAGIMPPAGWTHTQSSTITWEVTEEVELTEVTVYPQDGGKFAHCYWTDTPGNDQDEWMISHMLDLTAAEDLALSFYFAGSYHWSVDEFDNCDLTVYARVNSGAWNKLWDEHDYGVWEPWTWHYVLLSGLEAYEGQDNVQFAWVYTGFDGASFMVDNIVLGGNIFSDDPEPTNHVTNFAANMVDYASINTTWTDATGGQLPAGYLVKASSVGFGDITPPVDGFPEPNGLLVKNVLPGTELAAFTGLDAETTYYFKIYPYSNFGDNINYKTGGDVPQAQATTDDEPCDYCIPTASTDDDTGITRVVFNTIDNVSTGAPAYTDFTHISTTVEKGQSYDLSVWVNTDGNFNVYTAAWVDWDLSCTFDANENYDLGSAVNVANGITSLSPVTITIPEDAPSGATTMRVRARYHSAPTPCDNNNYSEAEDYTIIVVDPEPGDHKISGLLKYHNVAETALDDVGINLLNASDMVIATTNSDVNGYYEFLDLPNGDYTIEPTITLLWEGVTAMDITVYKKHIAQIPGEIIDNELVLTSGDVDANESLNVMDLIYIRQRIGGAITEFPAGDWLHTPGAVTIDEDDAEIDIFAMCYGDANRSYSKGGKYLATMELIIDEYLNALESKDFVIPLRVTNSIYDVSSVTLILDYNEEDITITDVEMAVNNNDLYYTNIDGVIRIVYSTLKPTDFQFNDPLLYLKGSLKSSGKDVNILNSAYGEFGNYNDNVIPVGTLAIAGFADATGISGLDNTIKVYPNPANTFLNISNVANSRIEVVTAKGNVVRNKEVSDYNTTINLVDLAAGTYFVRIYKDNEVIVHKLNIVR